MPYFQKESHLEIYYISPERWGKLESKFFPLDLVGDEDSVHPWIVPDFIKFKDISDIYIFMTSEDPRTDFLLTVDKIEQIYYFGFESEELKAKIRSYIIRKNIL